MFKKGKKQSSYSLYLGISLLFTLYYGLVFYHHTFTNEYVVQDDARQHVVWLQRFVDAELFPQDIIADYFQSLAPVGFKALYWLAAKIGIEPILLAKLLPPVLAIFTTIYTYLFTLQILPLGSCGFLSSLFINQLIWLNDDLVSATPRAFIYPLFAAFLYYLAKKSLIICLILMFLQGLFYPQILLLEITLLSLRLLVINRGLLVKLTTKKQPYIWWILGLVIGAIALYPITQKSPDLATVVTAQQMQQMSEFNLNGRSPFFGGGWFKYWMTGSSGLSLPIFPPIVWCGVGLPILLKTKLPLVKLITKKVEILGQVTVASLVMFLMAHILLPKLHLPSRYTYHSLRFILAITTAIVLTILLELAIKWLRNKVKTKTNLKALEKLKITLSAILAIAVIAFPAVPHVFIYWFQNWRVGTASEIYQYLAHQPKDILIASLSQEINNIPAFSQRSILAGEEFALAYHPQYYNQIKQRTSDLLQAQYSPNLEALTSFIQQYDVDYLLIDTNAFTTQYLKEQKWLINNSWSEATNKVIAKLESGASPASLRLVLSCSVVATENLNLLDTNCILNQKEN